MVEERVVIGRWSCNRATLAKHWESCDREAAEILAEKRERVVKHRVMIGNDLTRLTKSSEIFTAASKHSSESPAAFSKCPKESRRGMHTGLPCIQPWDTTSDANSG